MSDSYVDIVPMAVKFADCASDQRTRRAPNEDGTVTQAELKKSSRTYEKPLNNKTYKENLRNKVYQRASVQIGLDK